jgi:hypothetical protein
MARVSACDEQSFVGRGFSRDIEVRTTNGLWPLMR